MPAQLHHSDPGILGRRTLERDHAVLAEFLRPGLSVLDVGCGNGAITIGIARAVGPEGSVVGVDRDQALLARARSDHARVPNLEFVHGDVTSLRFQSRFDIVSAARTLQWIADPALAIACMKQAARPGGRLIVLDYNHQDNSWEPEPPVEFRRFYDAFLAWREANGWDNRIADRLPALFRAAGLIGVESRAQNEVVERGEPQFPVHSTLWSVVIESLGPQVVASGFLSDPELQLAREGYVAWIQDGMERQKLAMRAVIGQVP